MTPASSTVQEDRPTLEVIGLKKLFTLGKGRLFGSGRTIHAVDDVTLTIGRGETLGLVGESGCGKSTVGRMILRLTEPTDGQILVGGTDVSQLSQRQMRRWRHTVQIVFQDPFASLNPRMAAFDIVAEPLVVQNAARGAELRRQVAELFEKVGLPASAMTKHAHEFSAGSGSASVLPAPSPCGQA